MKPWIHAKNSARKFGGKPEDYIEIHEWFDQTKASHADMRHRAILHSATGIYIAEQVFRTMTVTGKWWNPFSWQIARLPYIINSDGKKVQIRDIGEQHVLDDMGKIPSLTDYLNGMPFYDWLGGLKSTKRKIRILD